MERLGGFIERIGLAMAGKRNPWGSGPKGGGTEGSGGGGEDGPGDAPSGDSDAPKPRGPRNPWLPEGGGEREPRRSANIEDIFRTRGPEGPRRGRGGPGGGGPGFRVPQLPGGGRLFPMIAGGIVLLWIGITSIHQLGPKEQGIVTTAGKYYKTIGSGISLTLPWPIQDVKVEPVSEIRIYNFPSGEGENLVLTGDQNLVDLSYLVRWNITDLKLFTFELAAPENTVREVAEAAMRASVAEHTLDSVLSGAGRADIEQRVRERMQAILTRYRSGIAIQGVEIRKTDPPAKVEDAFKDVSAAQQDAESFRNNAEAWAQQVLARAEGDAAAFDKVYAQYKLAPEVTRRRMYYETMERVLRSTDKTVLEAPGVTPYLPLPEVNRRSNSSAAGEGQ